MGVGATHCKVQELPGVSCAKTCGPILTIYTSYDLLLHKEVSFGGRDVTAFHLGVKSPQNLHLGRE